MGRGDRDGTAGYDVGRGIRESGMERHRQEWGGEVRGRGKGRGEGGGGGGEVKGRGRGGRVVDFPGDSFRKQCNRYLP